MPGLNTGKPLSPKLVITDLRDHSFEKALFLLGEADPEHPDGHDLAVPGKDLVTDVVGSDVPGPAPPAGPASSSAWSTSSTSTPSWSCAATRS